MQLTDESRIHFAGIPDIDSESNTQSFLGATLILLILVGILTPIAALITGLTGPSSAFFIALGISIYGMIIILRRWLVAGMAAATLVLASFNMGIPLTEFSGYMRIEIMPVDVFLIPLGFLAILDRVDQQIGRTTVLFCWLSFIFALWAVFNGIVHTLAGFPASSLYFGIHQLRYLLVVFVSILAVKRFSLRAVLVVILMTLSLHLGYAIIQSLLGQPLGLPYYGEPGMSTGGNMGSYLIGPLTLTTGLYPGGFFGSSRALLGTVFLLFPLAIYWSFKGWTNIPAFGLVLGTLALVAISRSDTGLILTPVVFVGVILMVKYKSILRNNLTLHQAVLLTVLVGGFALTSMGAVLYANVFAHSAIRVKQNVAAIEYFIRYPLYGIGGQNFPIITKSEPLVNLVGIHNTFLAYLSELGLIGFTSYVLASGIAFTVSLAGYIRDNYNPVMFGGLAAGMMAFHVYSSLTLLYMRTPVMLFFWSIAAATVAGGSISEWD